MWNRSYKASSRHCLNCSTLSWSPLVTDVGTVAAAVACCCCSSKSGGLSELVDEDDDADEVDNDDDNDDEADDEWEWIDDEVEPPLDRFLLTSLVKNKAAASISSLMLAPFDSCSSCSFVLCRPYPLNNAFAVPNGLPILYYIILYYMILLLLYIFFFAMDTYIYIFICR